METGFIFSGPRLLILTAIRGTAVALVIARRRPVCIARRGAAVPSDEPEEAAWISSVNGTRRSVAAAADSCRWYSELGNRKTRR